MKSLQPFVDVVWVFFQDHLSDAVTGAIGAFFGAWVAFLFERRKSDRAELAQRRADLLEVHMTLFCHANSLYDLRLQYDPFRLLPQRERRMPETTHTFDDLTIDTRKIAFLLDGAMPDLVLEIHTADLSYKNACKCLELRNQKLMELRSSIEIQHFDPVTRLGGGPGDLVAVQILKDATDAVFACLDDAFSQNLKMLRKLRDHAKTLFPKSTFKDVEFPPLPSEQPRPTAE
jgi:hypothetical protein